MFKYFITVCLVQLLSDPTRASRSGIFRMNDDVSSRLINHEPALAAAQLRAHFTDVIVSSARGGAEARPSVHAGDRGGGGTVVCSPARPREVGVFKHKTARSAVAGKPRPFS